MYCWDKATRTRQSTAGLTYDLMIDRIEAWDASPPIYLHSLAHMHAPGMHSSEPERLRFRQDMRRLFDTVPMPVKEVRYSAQLSAVSEWHATYVPLQSSSASPVQYPECCSRRISGKMTL